MAKQYYSLDEVVGSDDNLLTLDQVFGTPQERRQAAQARQQEVMRGLPQTFDAPLSPEQQKRLDNDVRHMADAGVGIGEAETMARAAYRAPGGEGVLQSFKKMVSPDENPIGFWEAFVEDPDKFVPVWGTLKGIGELASVLEAAKRLEADAYDTPAEERPYAGPFGGPYAVPGYTPPSNRTTFTKEQDQKTVNQWMEAEAERSTRGYSFGGRAGMIMGEMPAFIGDILLTKGLYTGSKAAVHTLLRTAGKEVVERQAKKALIAGGFKRLAAWAVASGIRSGAGTPHRVLETYLQNRLPENVKTDDDGNITFSWPNEAPVTTLLKAWGDIAIEMASEEAGETLTKGAGAIAKSLTKTRFGGKVLPKLYEVYRKIHPDTEWAEFVRRASTTAGFHGILGEMGEEYLGDQMRAVTGVDDFGAGPKAGMLKRMEAAFIQDIKMTPEMAASFAPLAGGAVLAERVRGRGARGESVTPTEPTAPRIQPTGMTADEMIEQFAGDVVNLQDIEAVVARAAADQKARAALETLFGKKVEVPDEAQAAPQEVPGVPAEAETAGVETETEAPTIQESLTVAPEAQAGEGRQAWEMTKEEWSNVAQAVPLEEDVDAEIKNLRFRAKMLQGKVDEAQRGLDATQSPGGIERRAAMLDKAKKELAPIQQRLNEIREETRQRAIAVAQRYPGGMDISQESPWVTIRQHRKVVQEALSAGKPVPRAILEEYQSEPWAQEALAKLEAETPPVRPSEPRTPEPAPEVGREGVEQAGPQAEDERIGQWWDHDLTPAGRADIIAGSGVDFSNKKLWRHMSDEQKQAVRHMAPPAETVAPEPPQR